MTEESNSPALPDKSMALQALDATAGELEGMAVASIRCGNTMESAGNWIGEFTSLVEKLHEFRVFEHNITAQYNMDRTAVSDEAGTLDAAMERYEVLLNSLVRRLETNDLPALSRLLTNELPRALNRIKSFIPLIRTHVNVQPA